MDLDQDWSLLDSPFGGQVDVELGASAAFGIRDVLQDADTTVAVLEWPRVRAQAGGGSVVRRISSTWRGTSIDLLTIQVKPAADSPANMSPVNVTSRRRMARRVSSACATRICGASSLVSQLEKKTGTTVIGPRTGLMALATSAASKA